MPVKRLLVVDDEKDIVTLLQLLLEREGYIVDIATSAYDALERAHDHRYEMLVTDLMMPGMDGFQLIKKLRQYYATNIPVLVVTAIKDPRPKLDAVGLHDADILEKPFVRKTLVAAIKKLVGEPNSA